MDCPYCNSPSKVTNSRSHNMHRGIWRRRKCLRCEAIWTTTESYDLSTTHRVKSTSSKHLQTFSRDKLFLSVFDSLKHRKDALEASAALTVTIIDRILTSKTAEISSTDIITHTTEVLQAFDQIGAALYTANHSDF